MALFKILKGKKENLDNYPLTDGQMYFTIDEKKLYIDHYNENNLLVRSSLSTDIEDSNSLSSLYFQGLTLEVSHFDTTAFTPVGTEETKLKEQGYIYKASMPVEGVLAAMIPEVTLSSIDCMTSGVEISN